ncbi:Peptidoglycan/LPS O-acetylase OafA/YrhL, contains acyltransferase and SGNH-hydrolase domains [Bradyrhizobium erythrophlei]|uniref:Peptidoglycan/LPS O-acetylase OafA/YrhL, contains acyltransferase and SGNH-hydrolase domains n=2 Tax=Bradyrhizobium erythrophlei TaxID=1437360 RepID=A0A1M7UHG2_9BRAD|nr:Peptidoglycan/LPS O-acetylase OafA/YrhL, contains acyltransferase and SGNH-hydrolase domains [Bradyrhizobium erythrophlei]
MEDNGWNQLDTVRLILASIVAVDHAVGIFVSPFDLVGSQISDALSQAAEVAVELFFLTSGLVIGRSLIGKSHYGDALFLVFMTRRIARIYPPLLFSVLLTVAMALILRALGLDRYHGTAQALTRDSFSYLDNLRDVGRALLTFGFRGGLTGSSNGPLWSLALEMQAYVVVGLLAQAFYSKRIWMAILCLIGLAFAIRAREGGPLNELSVICFGLFALGVLLNIAKPSFPKLLPPIPIDFSYSLYILHFPTMLFIFFLTCQEEVSAAKAWLLVSVSLIVAFAMSVLSGIFIERHRGPRLRLEIRKEALKH